MGEIEGVAHQIDDSFSAQILGQKVIGIGTDVIEVERVEIAVARNPRFAERVFTSQERTYCLSSAKAVAAQRFAARFAAKEAVLKALGLGLGGASFQDIEVIRSLSGKPDLVISGSAAEVAGAQKVKSWCISLSHSDTIAQAFVLAMG